jgi:hypothetical protein
VFCSSHHGSLNLRKDLSLLRKVEFADSHENALKTFMWFSQRHAKIILFQYLQDAADKSSSVPLTEREHAAEAFLEALTFGLLDTYEASGSFLASKNERVPRLI